jgi:predicted metal-dependent HD superfamily phosphohydrolase
VDRQRFKSLWERCRADGASGDPVRVFEELVRKYSEPGRYYHTPGHVDHCLRQFDFASSRMDDADAVEMALWFHDVVYEMDAADEENERRSAELFDELVGSDVAPGFRRTVCDLIMVTTHRRIPKTNDERFIIDIDLSSFGLPWDEFVRDSVAVRGEFPHLSDGEFFPKQKLFMKVLLNREHFCFTAFFRDRHERSARENITRYLDSLTEQGLI